MWIPDVRTIFFLLFLFSIVLTLTLFIFWKTQKTYSGFQMWMISLLVISLAYFLFIARDMISDFLSIVVANTLIVVSLMMGVDAVRRYFQEKVLSLRWYGLLIPYAGFFIVFLYGIDSFVIRSLILNSAVVICLCITAVIALSGKDKETRTLRMGFVITLLLVASLMMMRNIFLFLNSSDQQLLNADPYNVYLFLAASFVNLLATGFFLALNLARAQQELQESKDALRESEENYRNILRTAMDGYAIISHEKKFLDVNDAFCRLTGYTREELLTLSLADIEAKETPEKIEQHSGEIVLKGDDRFESQYRRKNGDIIDVEVSVVVSGTQNDLQFITFHHDITERNRVRTDLINAKNTLEQKVTERTNQLQLSLKEKEILLREIHHRVKNNLQVIISLIRLQKNRIRDPGARDAFQDSEGRIRSMALVHEKLYLSKDLATISLADYIRMLVSNIQTTYLVAPGKIQIYTDISDLELDINSAVPVGLILNELVTNSFKHAFPDNRTGKIEITGRRQDSFISIMVKDDGVGIPPDLDLKETVSLGMHLVHSLTLQLHGTLQVGGKPGEGASFTITFPVISSE